MKRVQVIAVASLVLCVSSAAIANAQGRGGRGRRMYDPKTVETVSGEVIRIEHVRGKGGGKSSGVHLMLKMDKEEISIHLGPAWYLEKQALKIAPHDKIEVRGSRITFEGSPAIIAAEVKKGDQIMKLRDESGAPAWRAQGRSGS